MGRYPVHDYVIVGAGSAGCVVANRLGGDPDVRVAVIEAGPPDDDPNIHMPFGFGLNLTSDFDWALFSEPEPGLAPRAHTPAPRPASPPGATTCPAAACSAARARSTR